MSNNCSACECCCQCHVTLPSCCPVLLNVTIARTVRIWIAVLNGKPRFRLQNFGLHSKIPVPFSAKLPSPPLCCPKVFVPTLNLDRHLANLTFTPSLCFLLACRWWLRNPAVVLLPHKKPIFFWLGFRYTNSSKVMTDGFSSIAGRPGQILDQTKILQCRGSRGQHFCHIDGIKAL